MLHQIDPSEKVLCEVKKLFNYIIKRSHGFKRRLEAMMQKPDTVLKLIRNVLNVGITADYVLMD